MLTGNIRVWSLSLLQETQIRGTIQVPVVRGAVSFHLLWARRDCICLWPSPPTGLHSWPIPALFFRILLTLAILVPLPSWGEGWGSVQSVEGTPGQQT